MKDMNRLTAAPLRTPRTVRQHELQVLTSMKPGVCAPIAAMPLFREDSLSASDVTVTVEMMETHELLLNRANLRVSAYVVPFQAFDRYQQSRDQLDRSYMGQPQIDGGAVVPFFETIALGAQAGTVPIYNSLGLHGKAGHTVNTMYLEAYNQIINMRLRNRSANLTKRARLDTSLAPAFWLNSQWEHVVPDFDQATMDGRVPLTVSNSRIPIRGIGLLQGTALAGLAQSVTESDGVAKNYEAYMVKDNAQAESIGNLKLAIKRDTTKAGSVPDIYAELSTANMQFSMADFANAKKTQWFAQMRQQFQGFVENNALDEYIIDMLMQGLSIPDQAMKSPMLIADVVTRFGQSLRYASDYANMAESAVSGSATAVFDLRVPRLSTGGIVMIMAEAMPDQLFERQADPFFYAVGPGQLPNAMVDELDVQKVDTVTNLQVDVDHATPNGTFGYEPMNGKWTRWGPRLGGKFHRPSTGATNDEVRQRVWAVETLNPTLGTSFYLCPPMNVKPFFDGINDQFEIAVQGRALIEGNTVFGPELIESTNLYTKVVEEIRTTQAKAVV